ncbi:MAG: hypothetical protein IJ205_01090 [Bacteroidales bacterium]|nr:hypothetical protein [Bacteroidales bacterium]
MKLASKRFVKAGLAALLAALGFASCSKPEDDPINPYTTIPGVYAYGTYPASFHGTLPSQNIVSDLPDQE